MLGAVWLHLIGERKNALSHAIAICALTLALTIGELIDFISMGSFEAHDHWPFVDWIFPPEVFVVDELSACQLPLATFSCRASWALIALLVCSTVPPYLELKSRGRCFRIYTIHMAAFSVLLIAAALCGIAVLVITLLILGGGLYPQPGVASRYHAASELTEQRKRNLPDENSSIMLLRP